MKTLKLPALLLVLMFFGISSLKAQTQTIQVTEAGDSTWNAICGAPRTVDMYMYGFATGFSFNDSITVQVFFGDGSDTTFFAYLQQTGQSYFGAWFPHTYQYPGQYTVQYIASSNDFIISDTLVRPNDVLIGDTCGNVSGNIYIDANNNCQFDQGESVMPNFPVSISAGGNIVAWDYTDQLGNYYFNVPTGFQYQVDLGNTYYSTAYNTVCPPSGVISVNTVPSTGNDFAVDCEEGFDLTGQVSGWGFRPGMNGTLTVCPRNLLCLPTGGQLSLVIDNPLITYVSANPVPGAINGDTLTWTFSPLTNLQYYGGCFQVVVKVDTNAQIGDTVCAEMIVEPISGDEDPSNNTGTFCFPVQNSWDPNDKAVSPIGIGEEGAILNNQSMTYTVRFQNTGTAAAINIFIMDTVDSDLDINTFRVLGSSHEMKTNILGGNILRFNFDDIWLADSTSNEPESHGFVTYRIDQKPGLVDGTKIENTANIYFDYNPAVVTNTVLSTIDLSLSVEENGAMVQLGVSIWPNPAQGLINIKFDKALGGAGVSLVDMTGRVIRTATANGLQMQIETSELPSGIYTLILNSNENELVRRKIVIVK